MTRKQPGDMTREERPELDERPGQAQGFGERGDELQESAACRKKGQESNRRRGAWGGRTGECGAAGGLVRHMGRGAIEHDRELEGDVAGHPTAHLSLDPGVVKERRQALGPG